MKIEEVHKETGRIENNHSYTLTKFGLAPQYDSWENSHYVSVEEQSTYKRIHIILNQFRQKGEEIGTIVNRAIITHGNSLSEEERSEKCKSFDGSTHWIEALDLLPADEADMGILLAEYRHMQESIWRELLDSLWNL